MNRKRRFGSIFCMRNKDEAKSKPMHKHGKTGSDDDDIEVLDSVSNFDNDNEANASYAGTQDAHISDASIAIDTSQERGIDVDDVEELGLISRFEIDSKANTGNAEAHNLHFSDTSMASDTNQTVDSTIAKSGTKIGGKRYKCGHCFYSTKYSHNLLCHKRTHTGEKPYKCSQCSTACSGSDALKRHMRTHTNEKPYNCNKCPFANAQPGAIAHTPERIVKLQDPIANVSTLSLLLQL